MRLFCGTVLRKKEKAARAFEAQAANIGAAALDLKAVNRNAFTRILATFLFHKKQMAIKGSRLLFFRCYRYRQDFVTTA
jgi:hypothetical protein